LASGFISPLKEGVLQIFITLKNSSPLPANLGSNGKHANRYTTKVTLQSLLPSQAEQSF
jgi:hypothetical protein